MLLNFLSLLYRNLVTIYANATIYLLLMQNLMSTSLQFIEAGYYNRN